MQLSMRIAWILFIIFILIIGTLGGAYLLQKDEGEGNAIVNIIQSIFYTDNSEDSDIGKGETSQDNGSSLDGSSSSGGGGSSSGGSSGSNCLTIQITYSMINSNRISVCNQNQTGICINKTIDCSIEIHNREGQVSGFFEVELKFAEEGKNESDAFETRTSRFVLGPKESRAVIESVNIQSSGENGTANKNISCFFSTLEVPTKCV